MKCIKNPVSGEIKRVDEYTAKNYVKYGWVYVTKGEYKKSVRPNQATIRTSVSKATGQLVTKSGGFRRLG